MFYFILQSTFLTQASFFARSTSHPCSYTVLWFSAFPVLKKTGTSLFQVATIPVPFVAVALVGFYFFFSCEELVLTTGSWVGCSTFFADIITSIQSSSEWNAWTPVKTGRKNTSAVCSELSAKLLWLLHGVLKNCPVTWTNKTVCTQRLQGHEQLSQRDSTKHWPVSVWFFCLQISDGGEACLR